MILVDGNSIGVASTACGDDTIGSFLSRIIDIRRSFTGNLLVLWDGERSWRYDIYEDYKANRRIEVGQEATASLKALVQLSETWKSLRPAVMSLLKLLGVNQVIARNMEADDLVAKFIKGKPNESHIMVTSDKDWLQLVADNVQWYDPRNNRTVNVRNFSDFTQLSTTWQFIQAKAITGDRGDNIPGVGGIGEIGCNWLLKTYGSVEGFYNASIMAESKGWEKKFRDFADSESKRKVFMRNMDLVWLNSPNIPEMIDLKLLSSSKTADKEQLFEAIVALGLNSFITNFKSIVDLFGVEHE